MSKAAPTGDQPVTLPLGLVTLRGNLTVPDRALGLVAFAHGSRSSRHSHRHVAYPLTTRHLATLLADLLTPLEEEIDLPTQVLRFNLLLLAERLTGIADWVMQAPLTQGLTISYFGGSMGGGAALIAAARGPECVAAAVSRGGRPDLAETFSSQVKVPTLLLVGDKDTEALQLNQAALAHLNVASRLQIIPGTTHVFEEPGALEEVAHHAAEWFVRHLKP